MSGGGKSISYLYSSVSSFINLSPLKLIIVLFNKRCCPLACVGPENIFLLSDGSFPLSYLLFEFPNFVSSYISLNIVIGLNVTMDVSVDMCVVRLSKS